VTLALCCHDWYAINSLMESGNHAAWKDLTVLTITRTSAAILCQILQQQFTSQYHSKILRIGFFWSGGLIFVTVLLRCYMWLFVWTLRPLVGCVCLPVNSWLGHLACKNRHWNDYSYSVEWDVTPLLTTLYSAHMETMQNRNSVVVSLCSILLQLMN